jgi:hypothetical protein
LDERAIVTEGSAEHDTHLESGADADADQDLSADEQARRGVGRSRRVEDGPSGGSKDERAEYHPGVVVACFGDQTAGHERGADEREHCGKGCSVCRLSRCEVR